MNITASDRTSLIRLAASLPVGDESRRAILAGLKSAAVKVGDTISIPAGSLVISVNAGFGDHAGYSKLGADTEFTVREVYDKEGGEAQLSLGMLQAPKGSKVYGVFRKGWAGRGYGIYAEKASPVKSAFTYSGIPENEKEVLMIVKDLFKMLDAKGYAKHIQLIDDGKVRVSGGDLRDFARIVEEQAEFGPQKVKKGDPGLKYLNFEFGEVMSSVSSQAEKYGVYPVKFVTFHEVISPLLAALSKRYQDHSKGIVHEHYQKWDATTDEATDMEVEFVWKRSPDGDAADLKSFARAFQTAAKERFESLSEDRHLVYTKGDGYWVRL